MKRHVSTVAAFATAISFGMQERAKAAPVLWSPQAGNGHYYETVLILLPNVLSWTAARDAAAARSFNNLPGHLVTITSSGEQGFLSSQFTLSGTGRFWLGGYQDTAAADYSEPAGGWRWVTGEPFAYANWSPTLNQPNNYTGLPESYLETYTPPWSWNDATLIPSADFGSNELVAGYVVEYESAVPEPATFVLAGLGLIGLAARRCCRSVACVQQR